MVTSLNQNNKKKILSICIGNNSSNLMGCENDAIIFYNINFLKPKYLLLGPNATFKNLIQILKLNTQFENILIFYSGHGLKGGNLKLYDKIIKPIEIYESINSNFNHPINLYFILDCCYSGSFPLLKNLNKINNTFIFSSCQNNQKSSESLVGYHNEYFNDYKPKLVNNNFIVIGIFTFNLIKLMKDKNINNIDELFNLENENIWKELELITNQKVNIKK